MCVLILLLRHERCLFCLCEFILKQIPCLLFPWIDSPSGPSSPHFLGFAIILRHTTLSRTHLGQWSARRRDFYLKTYNIYKTQTSMYRAGFEPAFPVSERSQTLSLERAATRISRQRPYRRVCVCHNVTAIRQTEWSLAGRCDLLYGALMTWLKAWVWSNVETACEC